MNDYKIIIAVCTVTFLLLLYVLVKCLVDVFYQPISSQEKDKKFYNAEKDKIQVNIENVYNTYDRIKFGAQIYKFEKRWQNKDDYYKKKSEDDATLMRRQLYDAYDRNVLNPTLVSQAY
jgi:hypothetical protein